MSTRGAFNAARFGVVRDDQASEVGLPVIVSTDDTVALSTGRGKISNYVNQQAWCLGHLFFLRYDFNGLPVRILDDAGNGGYSSSVKIADFPTGYVRLLSAKSNLSRIVVDNTDTAGTGITSTFDGDYSFGTTALTNAHATLTSTRGNIIPSTATAQAASSVSAGGIGRLRDVGTRPTALLDNSGGTAAATITTIVTGATVTPNTQNAIASLANELNDLINSAGAAQAYEFDGSSAAVDLFLNVIVDDADQDGGGDNGISGDLLTSGFLELLYIFV